MSETWPFLDGILADWESRGISVKGFSDEMKRQGFWLAGVANEEFLKDVQELLGKAQYEGKGLSDITPDLQKIMDKYGGKVKLHGSTKRAKSAYKDLMLRNATQSSFAGGRYAEMFSDEWMQLAPFWRYSAVRDARTRPTHAALHGRVFRKDDLAARRYLPPWAHNCRCIATSLTLEELEQGGYPVTTGSQAEVLPTSDGDLVGKPEASWNVDRVEATRSPALTAPPPVQPVQPPGGAPPPLPAGPPPPGGSGHRPKWMPVVEGIEAKIRGKAIEHAAIVAKDGTVLLTKTGSKSAVTFSSQEAALLKDAILTHNHPSGSSFSRFQGDVSFVWSNDGAEIRAVGSWGGQEVLYRLRRPSGGWTAVAATAIDLKAECDAAEAAVRASAWASSQAALLTSGALSPIDFQREVTHRIMQRLARRLGAGYERIVSP